MYIFLIFQQCALEELLLELDHVNFTKKVIAMYLTSAIAVVS